MFNPLKHFIQLINLIRKALATLLLKTLFRVKIFGLENLSTEGQVLIVANYNSYVDLLLISALLPGKCIFLLDVRIAKKLWLRPVLLLIDYVVIDTTKQVVLKQLITAATLERQYVVFAGSALIAEYEVPAIFVDLTNAAILPISIKNVRTKLLPHLQMTILAAHCLWVNNKISSIQRRLNLELLLYDQMSDLILESKNTDQTLFLKLLESNSRYGSRHHAVSDAGGTPLTYHNLITKSFILGRYLSRKTSSEEYVAILLPNVAHNLVTFFALQAFSRIPTMLNYTAGTANIILACQTADLKTIITSKVFITKAKLTQLIEQLLELGIKIIYLEDLPNEIALIDKIIGTLAAFIPKSYYANCNKTTDPAAVLLYTSGSEGIPKGVVLSHKNILTNAAQLGSRIDFGPSDMIFNILPLFHSFGLTSATLFPLFAGVQIIFYANPLHYKNIPKIIYDCNATIMFGTDTFLANYAKYARPYDFYGLRYVFAGGERLKDETYRNWLDKFGIKILEGYGVTELSPVIAANTPAHNKATTVGRLLPGMTCTLEAIEGIADHKLLVAGPNLMLGYMLHDKPRIIQPLRAAYDTGDIVKIDQEGYITILGRIKRFAKIGGEIISLAAIEGYVFALWPDYSHAVITINGDQIVLATTNLNATKELLINYFKTSGYNLLALPKEIMLLPAMPMIGSGKTDYVALGKILGG